MDPRSARAALDVVADSRSRAADRVAGPWWYHVGLGALLALLFLSMSLRMASTVVPAALLALVGLSLAARKATGVSLARCTATPGATLLFGVYALAFAVLAVTGMSLEWAAGVDYAIAVAGLVIGVLTVLTGFRVDAAARRDIRAGR
ncbi:hypothetical protein JNW98_13605 [Streptomyces sp. SCA2-4]|nr:hypothetical protein [Streptomyces huiliensis]